MKNNCWLEVSFEVRARCVCVSTSCDTLSMGNIYIRPSLTIANNSKWKEYSLFALRHCRCVHWECSARNNFKFRVHRSVEIVRSLKPDKQSSQSVCAFLILKIYLKIKWKILWTNLVNKQINKTKRDENFFFFGASWMYLATEIPISRWASAFIPIIR